MFILFILTSLFISVQSENYTYFDPVLCSTASCACASSSCAISDYSWAFDDVGITAAGISFTTEVPWSTCTNVGGDWNKTRTVGGIVENVRCTTRCNISGYDNYIDSAEIDDPDSCICDTSCCPPHINTTCGTCPIIGYDNYHINSTFTEDDCVCDPGNYWNGTACKECQYPQLSTLTAIPNSCDEPECPAGKGLYVNNLYYTCQTCTGATYSPHGNDECLDCTICNDTEYETQTCTVEQNRKCASKTKMSCPAGEYFTAGGPTADNTCTPCSSTHFKLGENNETSCSEKKNTMSNRRIFNFF